MKVAYLLDTDWIIDYFNDKEPISSKIEILRDEGIGISIISLAELYEGVRNSRNQESSEKMLLGFISGVAIVGIDEGIVNWRFRPPHCVNCPVSPNPLMHKQSQAL